MKSTNLAMKAEMFVQLVFFKVSLRKLTKAGVPQCFILDPLIFLIYGNDIKENIQSNIKKNSDDTSLINTFHNQVVGIQVLN
jgi:hypothetical protein